MFRNHHSLVRSFIHAFRGIRYAFGERSFVIQVIIGFLAIAFAFVLKLTFAEKAVIIIFSALVLVVEIINTAFERTLDKICPEQSADIARIKDLSAAAVLIFSAAAFFVGAWIFVRAVLCK
jgi:diacylglycerol kinase